MKGWQALVLATLGLSGCAGWQASDRLSRAPTGAPAAPPAAKERPQRVTAELAPPAFALLEEADRLARAGDGDGAAAALERAIKLQPDSPWLWHRLAVLRLQQEEFAEAERLALRSNGLAGADRRLLAGNWQVVAMARRNSNDAKGAAQAWRQVEFLKGRP